MVLSGSSPVAGKAVRAAFDGGRLTSDAGVLRAGGDRAPARDRRAPGALPRGPAVAGAGAPHPGRDDPLPGAADRGRLPGRERLRRPAHRPGVQDGGRPGARERGGPVLAADHVPAREPAHGHRAQADDGGHGRAVLRQLRARCRGGSCSTSTTPRTGSTAARSSRSSTPTTTSAASCRSTSTSTHHLITLFHPTTQRCFLPIHVYEAITGKPVAVILRPGKTPDGAEVALVLRHVIRRIRARWPKVDILVRGDSHYGRPEAMSWCERNRVGYVFGLAGNKVLLRRVAGLAEEAALAPGRGRGREGPPLRRVRLRRQDLERRAAGDRPGRGVGPGRGQPVRRHQPRRHAALALRGRLLCSRPGGKSGEGPQAPPRLGPDLVQQGDRQPVPPGAAHRRLLAPAHPARLGAEAVVLARRPSSTRSASR